MATADLAMSGKQLVHGNLGRLGRGSRILD